MFSGKQSVPLWSALSLASALAACDVFDETLERRVESASRCQRHLDCSSSAPSLCLLPEGRCAPLASEDCALGSGSLKRDDTLILGSLFAKSGAQMSTNLVREQSAVLAVEEINAHGGVPVAGQKRPLALVTCDATRDARRAARHLVEGLKVPALIGPNNSQDVLDVTTEVSARAGVLLLSPTALAASISDVLDDDLTFTMVPSDEQRTPLTARQIAELEQKLLRERPLPLRLSIVFRDDALGQGTRAGLAGLVFNGKKISESIGREVQLAPYDAAQPEQARLVAAQAAFAPDIVVLAGTAESVTQVMAPLEQSYAPGRPKPHYLLIDSGRVPELLELVRADDDLRRRVQGTGLVSDAASAPVLAAFQAAFERRFPGQWAMVSGAGPSYDAVYALAYALAGSVDAPSGRAMANGLRRLGMGLELPVGVADSAQAFAELAAGRSIRPIGTLAPLAWDMRGGSQGGTVETWCIAASASGPKYQSGGLTYSVATQTLSGQTRDCERAGDDQTPPREQDAGAAVPVLVDGGSDGGGADSASADGGSAVDAAAPEDSGAAKPPEAGTVVPPNGPCTAVEAPPPPVREGGVIAQVRAMNTDPKDALIMPFLRVTNMGDQDLPLSSLRVRYYFRNEHAALCPENCVIEGFWSGIQPGGTMVAVRRRYDELACGASFLELSFPPGPRALRRGESVEVQQSFHTRSYSETFDETNDYSFSPGARDYQTSDRITVYRDDRLIWGAPPY